MKTMLWSLIIVAAVSGCTTRNQFGECLGVLDSEQPTLQYEVSVWNVVVAVMFSSTIVVPLYTVAKDIKCPSGTR